MVYRTDEIHGHCVVCEADATVACGRCNAPLCAAHRGVTGACATCELAAMEQGGLSNNAFVRSRWAIPIAFGTAIAGFAAAFWTLGTMPALGGFLVGLFAPIGAGRVVAASRERRTRRLLTAGSPRD